MVGRIMKAATSPIGTPLGCGRSPSGTTKTARLRRSTTKGEPIEQAWAKIGTFYIRKSAFERGQAFPQTLRVTVSYD